MKLTKEEYRVYSTYTSGFGGGFKSQERCFELLNERTTTNDCRYSQYDHYYKIK